MRIPRRTTKLISANKFFSAHFMETHFPNLKKKKNEEERKKEKEQFFSHSLL